MGVEFVQADHDWKAWIGRTQTAADWITPSRVAAWHATLDHSGETPKEGDAAPLGFHWTLAPGVARESELGPGRPRAPRRVSAAGDVAAPAVGGEPRDVSTIRCASASASSAPR